MTPNMKPLRPLKKGEQRTRDIARMGGLVKSKRKTRANRIKALKSGKYAKHSSEFYVQCLKDPDKFIEFLGTELSKLMAMDMDDKTRIRLYETLLKTSQTVFGTKQKVESVSINIDVEVEELAKRLKKMDTVMVEYEEIKK